MWVSAFSMNVLTSAIAAALLTKIKTGLITPPRLALYLALALIIWCDIALVMDATSRTRRQAARMQASPRSSLDWVVWIAALVLSSYFLWRTVFAVRAYQLGRFDILLTALGLNAAALFFDIALIIHALKSRQSK